MNEELKAKLERYLPVRVVLRLHEGRIDGLVEHSFAMDWQKDRVNIFWSGKAYSMLGEHMLDATKDAAHNCKPKHGVYTEFVFDPLAEDSPIEVNWDQWFADKEAKRDKFMCRNAKFTMKPHGPYMLRAMAAEKEIAYLKPRYEERGRSLVAYQEQEEKIRAALDHAETEETN